MGTFRPRRQSRLTFCGVWHLLACLLAAGFSRAEGGPEPSNQKNDKRVVRAMGTVRDAANRPVVNATVWLVGSDSRRIGSPEQLSETRTGAKGEFSLFAIVGPYTALKLIARDSRGRIGWSFNSVAPGVNAIRLREVRDLRGRVDDDDGRPIAGARVVPRSFFGPASNQRSSAGSVDLFTELGALFEGRTDKDGRFVLPQIPEQVRVQSEISAPGFGKGDAYLDFNAPVVVKLERPGTISGALVPLEGAEADKGSYKLRLWRELKEVEPGTVQPIIVSHSEEVTTDEEGAFHSGELPPGRYSIAPIQGQGRPFFAHPTTYAEAKPGETTEGVSVPVVPTVRLTGRVIDRQTGKGIENVVVYGYQFVPSPVGDRRTDHHETATDAKGRYELRLPAGKMRVFVYRTPPEYLVPPPDTQNTPREIADDDEWPTFELPRAAQVEGVVLDDQDRPASHAGLHIDLHRHSRRPFDWLPDLSDGDGKFTVRQVDPEVRFSLRARTRDAVTEGVVLVTASELKGPVELKISKENVFRLRGKAVDETGLPVPEAKVSLEWERSVYGISGARMPQPRVGAPRFLDQTRRRSELAELVTDVDGKFESPVLWPGDNYQLIITAPGYAELKTSLVEGVAGGVQDFGSLTLTRNDLVVAGAVVDDQGRKVADAEIQVVIPGQTPKPPVRSDERGRFSITGIDASVALPLRARSATAATNGATVVLPADFGKPVKLVVAAKHAFRLRGTIFDRQGKPTPGARVSVVWDRRAVQQPITLAAARRETVDNMPVMLDRFAAGADGAFETPALWPDENYHLIASAPGYDYFQSATVFGPAGEITALAPFALTRNDLEIKGRVVDSAGKPLEGAAVLNTGDAEMRRILTTDAAGSFVVSGLFEGPVHLLTRKPGYRAAGWRGVAGDEPIEIEIVLLSGDEPRRQVALAKVEDANRFEAAQRLARRLLVELWALRERFDDNPHRVLQPRRARRPGSAPVSDTATRLAKLMARLDLAQGLSWSAAEAGRLDEAVRVAAVEADFDNDVDRALKLLHGVKTVAARSALLDMARRAITAGKQEPAIRLLEAALAMAPMDRATSPAFDLPSTQAQVATLAIQAGAANWGEKLLFAAADAAEKLDNQLGLQARGEAAVALAAGNPDRALRLLKTIELQRNYDYTPRAIVALGPKNSHRTREFLRLLEPGLYADSARTPLAYQLAARNLKAAMQVVAAMNEQDAPIKADTLGLMALAVAPRDRTQAYALIDQALDLLLDTRGIYTASFGGRPADGARLALAAKKIDYPDMPTVIDCVLALRSSVRGGSSPSARAAMTVNRAKGLALVDPATARELLISCEADARFLGDSDDSSYGWRSVGRGQWLQAWALVDLGEAEGRCAEEMARLRTQGKIETAGIAVLPLLELLVVPPSERTRFVVQSISPNYWFPDDWR